MVTHHQGLEPDYVNDVLLKKQLEDLTISNENIEDSNVLDQLLDEENILQSETCFIPSMYTRQLSPLETSLENSIYQVSMVVHNCEIFTLEEITGDRGLETSPGMTCSMVYHQLSSVLEDRRDDNHVTKGLTSEPMNINQLPSPSSMVSHQLPSIETPADFSKFLVSTASLTSHQGDIDLSDSGFMTSMVTHQQSNEQEYIDDKTLDSELDSIHMDCHKETFLDPLIGVEVCDPTLTEFQESDHFKESDFDHFIGTHQSRDIKQENAEDDVENTFISHQAHASCIEDDVQEMENLSQSLNTEDILKEYAPLEREKFQSIQEGLESVPDEFHITSLVSHQLQSMAICDQFEYLDYIPSMASHQDMPTIDEEEADIEANLGSMVTHMAINGSYDDDNLKYTPDE